MDSASRVRYSGRMRTLFPFIIVALLLPLPAFGQEWALDRVDDVAELRATTDRRIDDGYTPVALDISDELGLTVLYTRLASWDADSYVIEELSTLDDLNELVTSRIREGWFPMDFSVGADANALLFTSTADVVGGWRIVSAPGSSVEVQKTVSEYRAEGFTPMGISALDDDQLALLLLDLPEREAPASMIMGVPTDPEEAVVGLQSMVADGWTPISITTIEDEMVVLFLQL